MKALFECAHTSTVATFIAFPLWFFITLAERAASHERMDYPSLEHRLIYCSSSYAATVGF